MSEKLRQADWGTLFVALETLYIRGPKQKGEQILSQMEGYVEAIRFHNEENGYTVFTLVSEGDETTCFGNLVCLHPGDYVRVSGEMTVHPLYGEQLKVEEFSFCEPKDQLAVERYLASGAIKGIGVSLAARIVAKFGDDTYRILEEEPERLAEVRGISERKAREIAGQLIEQQEMRKTMLFLQQYGISVALSAKIYQCYKEDVYQIIRENPYRLAEDISGVGFRIADEIAARVGVLADSEFRIASGLLFVLSQAGAEGHTCLPRPVLLERAQALLEVSEDQLQKGLMDLTVERKVVARELEGEVYVYSGESYYTEMAVARMLLDLNQPFEAEEEQVLRYLDEAAGKQALIFDELQRSAVLQVAKSGLTVITGGPGTGKTTIINLIIGCFLKQKKNVLLAAPTGRAAKRMTEATGYEAQTIHRLLELSGSPEEPMTRFRFGRDQDNPLEADLIIIDEMSMVDIYLMKALLSAITVGTRLVLVGDVCQLPSVGPGAVLKDIISSECFPVVELLNIFRQATESDIVVNAHRINHGQEIRLDNQSADFFFLQRTQTEVIVQSVVYLVQSKLPPYVQATPFDIQVLTPMRKGALGVENLNRVLQRHLNPPSAERDEKEHRDGVFRVGDKVMQIKNNYQLEWHVRNSLNILVDQGMGVFNGDMGIITEIDDFAQTVTVLFDELREVLYPYALLDELELAYAVTIHKSQGSEYAAVVLPLLSGPHMLFNRSLLYTAVTRARRCVTIVGDRETIRGMIDNESEQRRFSGLCWQIREMGGADCRSVP